ncbi:hypothetical protein [Enterovibrio coralii]|uniref:Uncharacterized protein n=1 Tax=Enterovibrio coralii TaxID=294935 RepID=A0A135I6Z6_9GAMM|nr:hypothetical protein [Enterovibrio coralii]KXF81209.1 hypothetical protein ATN88_00095 [Enterovibrio coralii]
MLKVTGKNVIAGYAPCPVCHTLSTVHFPSGGKRANTPYLRCGNCDKTVQSADVKHHIAAHYAPTLDNYALRFGADVSAEREQVIANKWAENPDLYAAKMHPIEDDDIATTEEAADDAQCLDAADIEDISPSLTLDHDTQRVVAEPDPKPEQTRAPDWGSMVFLVVCLCLVGGVIVGLVRYKRHAKPLTTTKQELTHE